MQFLDIWSRMQRERIMYIGQDLDDEYANQVCLGCSAPNFAAVRAQVVLVASGTPPLLDGLAVL